MVKTLLWLDDYRDPMEGQWLVFSPIKGGDYEVHWVKNYDEFVRWIEVNGLPTGICFDHDLGLENHVERVSSGMSKRASKKLKPLEKTGMDCAKWLVEYCLDKNLKLPLWNIQSANPVGKENIRSLLTQFENKKD